MLSSKLPQTQNALKPAVSSPSQPVLVRLRPVVTLSSLALVLGGSIGAFAGFVFFGWMAAALGAGTLLFSRFFIKKPAAILQQFELQEAARFKELKRQIRKTQYLENVGELGEKTAQQLEQISKRFDKFALLLSQKFNPRELTFGRYYSAAEQTHLATLDNLSSCAASLNQLDVIDESNAERQDLRQKQIEKIKELLAENEKAITEFDRVSTALSSVRIQRGEADVGLEQAMAELTELGQRAKKYASPSI